MIAIHTEHLAEHSVLHISGSMTAENAAALERAVDELVTPHRNLAVCIADVAAVDICGIYILLRVRQRLAGRGGTLQVHSREPQHRALLTTYGIAVSNDDASCCPAAGKGN